MNTSRPAVFYATFCPLKHLGILEPLQLSRFFLALKESEGFGAVEVEGEGVKSFNLAFEFPEDLFEHHPKNTSNIKSPIGNWLNVGGKVW